MLNLSLYFFKIIVEIRSNGNGRNAFVIKDSGGVERSNKPFVHRPELDLDIRRDIMFGDPSQNFVQRAMVMLGNDVSHNPLLLQAWHQGMIEKPEFATVLLYFLF